MPRSAIPIGGVGPETTTKIYLSIINQIRNRGKETYPPLIIYNLPFPFTLEYEAIVRGVNSEKMIPYLIEGAKILEKSGANFGILPCNTLHKFITEIRQAVRIPFLSMIDETVAILKEQRIKKVGILATATTIASNMYKNNLKINGIKTLYPSPCEQNSIGEIILELLKGKGDKNEQRKRLETICQTLQQRGAEIINLACTDLQLIGPFLSTTIPVVDTTEILINASVREMIKS